MPRRDGTGPMGVGPMTGRGMGVCCSYGAWPMGRMGRGLGMGRRGGFGGFLKEYNLEPEVKKEFLRGRREFLENQLEFIKKQQEEF
ncbi:MAG: DUF5320 domain-containing protein [Clostridia bacterium]|nr:DUF5320 domain-containing protein [Clostridia bacterium]